MSRVINEDFAPDENYEEGIVENAVVRNYKDDTDLERLKNKNKKLKLKNRRYKDNTEIRKSLVVVFTVIIVFWLLSVLLILVGNNCNHYNLSENTLIAFLTTSSANVIGMMYVILKNLFPVKAKKTNRSLNK